MQARRRAVSRSRTATTSAVAARIQRRAAHRSSCRRSQAPGCSTARVRRISSASGENPPPPPPHGGRLGVQENGYSIQQRPELTCVHDGRVSLLLGCIEVLTCLSRELEDEPDCFVGQGAE